MSTPRHSETATKAALSIALQYLPTADRKTRGEIAGIIDRCIKTHGPFPAATSCGSVPRPPDDIFNAEKGESE